MHFNNSNKKVSTKMNPAVSPRKTWAYFFFIFSDLSFVMPIPCLKDRIKKRNFKKQQSKNKK